MFFLLDHNLMFMSVWSILDSGETGNMAGNTKRE